MLLRSFITRSSRVQLHRPPPPSLKFFALSSFATTSSGLTEYQKLQMAVKDKVESAIASHNVVVFSKSYCPFCRSTKESVQGLGVTTDQIYVYELDQNDDGSEIQSYLAEKTGQRTVPNVFISQKHVGGNDKFQSQLRAKNIVVKDSLAQVVDPSKL